MCVCVCVCVYEGVWVRVCVCELCVLSCMCFMCLFCSSQVHQTDATADGRGRDSCEKVGKNTAHVKPIHQTLLNMSVVFCLPVSSVCSRPTDGGWKTLWRSAACRRDE